MQPQRHKAVAALGLTLFSLFGTAPSAVADPCGMVPPLWLGDGEPITRVGLQKTYVFYKDGIESFVIRPGFSGKVDEFGMLIPFPSPPAIRKVADDVFPHVAAAVDPPEVLVDLTPIYTCGAKRSLGYAEDRAEAELSVIKEEVRVLREEAVGMYEVAVLEAGSAQALKRWMDDHGYRYPAGMDATCEDYVEDGWCFVAVKARVGRKSGSDPRPGMEGIETELGPGGGFDGHVQAMGFRFRTDEMILPMRLSVFNEGDLHNVLYILADDPLRVSDLSESLVVRQIDGRRLYHNLFDPLPVRVIGGSVADIPAERLRTLPAEREASRVSGIARQLFASDLLAARSGQLALRHEELEKELLAISESLGMRGRAIDALHAEALADLRDRREDLALTDLDGMTLTILDGDFPRERLAADNLRFENFRLAAASNTRSEYDATAFGPAPALGGTVAPPGPLDQSAAAPRARLRALRPLLAALSVAGGLLFLLRRRSPRARPRSPRLRPRVLAAGSLAAVLGALALLPSAMHRQSSISALLAPFFDDSSVVARGRAIVELVEHGGVDAEVSLRIAAERSDSPLERVWARAARIRLARTSNELLELSAEAVASPALVRPLRARWEEQLTLAGDVRTVADALDAASRFGPLRDDMLRHLLDCEPRFLGRALFQADTTGARNLAAGILATAGQRGSAVAPHVLSALRFDPEAERVPWADGPLFLPALRWSPGEARVLFRQLIAWHLWCEQRELSAAQEQLHNNLRSVGLANAAGYSSPGWNAAPSTTWLRTYGQSAGAGALLALLAEQGLEDDPRYRGLVPPL